MEQCLTQERNSNGGVFWGCSSAVGGAGELSTVLLFWSCFPRVPGPAASRWLFAEGRGVSAAGTHKALEDRVDQKDGKHGSTSYPSPASQPAIKAPPSRMPPRPSSHSSQRSLSTGNMGKSVFDYSSCGSWGGVIRTFRGTSGEPVEWSHRKPVP